MSDDDEDRPRRAPRRLTFADAVEIQRLIRQGVYQHRIAARFDVNQGRVAEIKKGDLFPGSLTASL
jgi:predicted XRE-type DNA-binding protein